MEQGAVARVWGEVGFHTQEKFSIAVPTLGAAFLAAPAVEIETIVPLAFVGGQTRTQIGYGNLYVGANYVQLDSDVRVKIGGGLSLPTAARNGSAGQANALALAPDAFQQSYYRIPEAFGFVVPLRIEGGTTLVPSVDFDAAALVTTGHHIFGAEAALIVDLAPGFAGYITPQLLCGLRMPLFWAVTAPRGDNAQFAFEPFFRGQIYSGFLDLRLTIPIDEPLGPAFDRGKYWGVHFGGGAAF
jgi:hypothetical protein